MNTMSRKRLLLVEDEPADEKLALRALRGSGQDVTVTVAHDGAEAIELLHGPAATANQLPGLVLLDIKLPRIDGLEVLRRLRADARTRYVPVIILSGSREERDLSECYRLGANAYVRKPLDFEEFSEAMRLIAGFWLKLNEGAPEGAP